MWLVQKIGLDQGGEIDRVQWQEADVARDSWLGQPVVVPVIDVVNAVLVGKVGTVMLAQNGGTVPGPYIRTFVRQGGIEGIEADTADGDDRTLFDLPRLGDEADQG